MSASRVRLAMLGFALLVLQCGHEEVGEECTAARFASALAGPAPHCAEIAASTLEDGTSACRAFAASSRAVCDCDVAGRRAPRQSDCRLNLETTPDSAAFSCLCELVQLQGVALDKCLNDKDDATDGWCYAARSPRCGPAASEEVTSVGASDRLFKLQGGAELGTDERLLLSCVALGCD